MIIRPVILCGGIGSRLWPESRTSYPKQFIDLFDGKSLLEITLERFKNNKNFSDPILVTNSEFKFYVLDILKKLKLEGTLLLEPLGQGTTASIFIASKISKKNELLFVTPADQVIENYVSLNKKLIKISKDFPTNNILTFGIKPSYPSSGFGYIKVNKQNNLSNLCNIEKFIEKPNQTNAKKFIKDSNYFWNSGMFMAYSSTFLNSIYIHAKKIYQTSELAFSNAHFETKNIITFSLSDFKKIPKLSIDYSVMEKSKQIKCFPINLVWNDLGSWDMFSKLNKNKLDLKKHYQIESSNNFLKSKDKIIATIGIKNTIIVDTDDALLVAKKGMSEKVKDAVNIITTKNPAVINENNFEFRPWGKFEVLLDSKNCKVKKLTIEPKSRLSLQYHKFRSEHWTIIKGVAKVHLNGKIINLKEGNSIDIPSLSEHFIANETESKLIIIEIQMGSYFGEDDIIRINDTYNRKN